MIQKRVKGEPVQFPPGDPVHGYTVRVDDFGFRGLCVGFGCWILGLGSNRSSVCLAESLALA